MVNNYIKSNNPILHLVQNDVMKSVLKKNSTNNIYAKIEVNTKVQFNDDEINANSRFNQIIIDFYNFEDDEYLYSISFSRDWMFDLRMLGPVNAMSFEILSIFNSYWDKTDDSVIVNEERTIDRSINAHFYLRSDDPNIVPFQSEFYTDKDKYFALGKSYTLNFPEGYYYFVCSESIDNFSRWYIIFVNELPRFFRK